MECRKSKGFFYAIPKEKILISEITCFSVFVCYPFCRTLQLKHTTKTKNIFINIFKFDFCSGLDLLAAVLPHRMEHWTILGSILKL